MILTHIFRQDFNKAAPVIVSRHSFKVFKAFIVICTQLQCSYDNEMLRSQAPRTVQYNKTLVSHMVQIAPL